MVAKLSHENALDFILAGNCTFTAKPKKISLDRKIKNFLRDRFNT